MVCTEDVSSSDEDAVFGTVARQRRAAVRRKLARAAEELREKARIAKSLQTSDMELVHRIRSLGFDGQTAIVVDLLPLVHVAWADGSVTVRERATILEVLTSRGIEADSEARLLIEAVLEERPSEAYLETSIDLVRDLLGPCEDHLRDLADLCMRVAAAAGRLGLVAGVRPEERASIEAIAARLGDRAAQAFHARLNGVRQQ